MAIPNAYKSNEKQFADYLQFDDTDQGRGNALSDYLFSPRLFKFVALLGLCYGGLKAYDLSQSKISFKSIIHKVKGSFDFTVSALSKADAQDANLINEEAVNASDIGQQLSGQGYRPTDVTDETKPGQKEDFFDPLRITSQNDVKILAALAKRRTKLDAQELQLKQKKAALEAVKKRLSEKSIALEKLERDLRKMLNSLDIKQSKKLQNLIKTYETMKPNDAAKIFNTLDMETLLNIVSHISAKKLAPIMAAMNVERAKEITNILTMKNTPFNKDMTNIDLNNPG